MAAHEALYPLITLDVMGCPAVMIDTAINRAAAEFCQDSIVWQEDLDPVTVIAGLAEYDLDLPARSSIVVIRDGDLKLDGRALTPIMAPASLPGDAAAPRSYYVHSRGAIILHPTPIESGAVLTVRAVLKPTLLATTVPDVLADQHYEAIAEGAKAILKRIPNQPWSDPAGARDAYQLFKQKTTEARISMEFGSVAGSMRVTPRTFGQ